MLRALPRHGYPDTAIGHIAAEAGVSRAAFYQQFESKEDCFLATCDIASRWLCEQVEAAVAPSDERADRIRVGVSEALDLLVANPPLAHLIAVEALQAGRPARERRQACLARLARALRPARSAAAEVAADLEELLLGVAISLAARYIETGRTVQLPEAKTALIEDLLIPYLCWEEASPSRSPRPTVG